jgi:hypothetical protein
VISTKSMTTRISDAIEKIIISLHPE